MEQSENSRMTESSDGDILSTLPDCLLHHIMSFLTALEAVRTCILSKRWENLWTALPVLNFDLNNFKDNMREWYGSVPEEDGPEDKLFAKMFRHFVTMTLLHREPTDLLKFRLSCSDIDDVYWTREHVRSWIRYVLGKNPQVLNISCATRFSLKAGIFNCKSLVDLTLYHLLGNQISAVNLPCLRRLYLHNIRINQDFMKKLLCGCPVLESLHLMYCNMEVSTIHSQSLKYLTIKNNRAHLDGRAYTVMELINAPNLLCFFYGDCCQYIGHKMILNMPSLTSAIVFKNKCFIHPPDNGKSNILTGISSVRSLKLGESWIKELLQSELPNLPNFQNVKDLSMTDFCLCCNLNLLASFLEHFPNLEILSFWHDSLCEVEVYGDQESLKIAPFECKHLHTVNVNFFACNNDDIHRAKKYLEDCTKDLRAKINITDCASYPNLIWFRETL